MFFWPFSFTYNYFASLLLCSILTVNLGFRDNDVSLRSFNFFHFTFRSLYMPCRPCAFLTRANYLASRPMQQLLQTCCINDSLLTRLFLLPQTSISLYFILGGTRKKFKEMEDLRKQEESRQQRFIVGKENLVAAEAELEAR